MTDEDVRKTNLAMAALCGYRVVRQRDKWPVVWPWPFVWVWESGYAVLRLTENSIDVEWSPVTNPLQALEVAEALRSQGWDYTIRGYAKPEEEFDCEFCRGGHGPKDATGYCVGSDTPAEAICLAAAAVPESEGKG